MKNGKYLENLIYIIQNSFINDSKTKVFKNKKLKNTSGNFREFDIIIETNINNLSINIAIECKDYKSPVSVEKTEAFNSKCLRVPEIHKKIMISSKGFQKDAISAAKSFGIEIYNFNEIENTVIKDWVSLEIFKPYNIYINFDFVEINFNKEASFTITEETLFRIDDLPVPISLPKFINSLFQTHKNNEYKSFVDSDLIVSKQFQIKFDDNNKIRLNNDLSIHISELNLIFHFYKEIVQPIKYEELKSKSNSLMANIVTYKLDESTSLKLISTEQFKNEKLITLISDKKSGEIKNTITYNIERINNLD